MRSIKQILMDRDNMLEEEAQDLINEAKEQLDEYLAVGDMISAEEICYEYFGLEPDYLMQLI